MSTMKQTKETVARYLSKFFDGFSKDSLQIKLDPDEHYHDLMEVWVRVGSEDRYDTCMGVRDPLTGMLMSIARNTPYHTVSGWMPQDFSPLEVGLTLAAELVHKETEAKYLKVLIEILEDLENQTKNSDVWSCFRDRLRFPDVYLTEFSPYSERMKALIIFTNKKTGEQKAVKCDFYKRHVSGVDDWRDKHYAVETIKENTAGFLEFYKEDEE